MGGGLGPTGFGAGICLLYQGYDLASTLALVSPDFVGAPILAQKKREPTKQYIEMMSITKQLVMAQLQNN